MPSEEKINARTHAGGVVAFDYVPAAGPVECLLITRVKYSASLEGRRFPKALHYEELVERAYIVALKSDTQI